MESTVVRFEGIGRISCDVRDFAPLLPASAQALRWQLVDSYEAVDVLVTTEAYEEGYREIPREPMGFDAVSIWWSRQFQSIWGTYVAAADDATLAAFPGEYLDRIAPETLERYPFALQAVDSSFWLVHSTDDAFLRAVEARFERVTRMPYDAVRAGS